MTVKEITRAYKTGEFPDAYCMFTSSLESVTCIAAENGQVITTENGRGLSIDGN